MNKKNAKAVEIVIEKDFNLAQSIEDTIQNMLKDKEENPDLIIPYSFLEFYNKPEMHDLIFAVFEYCKCLAQINSRINQLKDEGKHREASKFSEVHSSQLPELGKNAAQ